MVNPRNLGEEILSIALGKATPNDDGADLSRFFPGELFPDNAQGFLAGGLNESTGVYQHNIGVGGIRGDGPAVSDQVAKHLLGVDKVLGQPRLIKAQVFVAILPVFRDLPMFLERCYPSDKNQPLF